MVKTFEVDKQNSNNLHGCPDTIRIPEENIDLNYKDENTLTFIVGVNTSGDLQLICSKTLLHTYLLYNYQCKNGKLNNTREGRLWMNEKLISVWNDLASSDMEVISYLFKEVLNLDISNYTFVSDFDYRRVFMATVSEFEKMGISGDWSENDWNRLESMSKKQNNNIGSEKSTNTLGIADKDMWRHFMYNEGKKKRTKF